jgi:hypothetical protein
MLNTTTGYRVYPVPLACEGCGETTEVLRWWRIELRGGGTDEALYCDACGEIVAAGEADGITHGEVA